MSNGRGRGRGHNASVPSSPRQQNVNQPFVAPVQPLVAPVQPLAVPKYKLKEVKRDERERWASLLLAVHP